MKRWLGGRSAAWVAVAWLAWQAPLACAAEARFAITEGGAPVADAVVSLHAAASTAGGGARARMDQQHSTFVPGVLPIQVGTQVDFPNRDNIQHQVYSFSQAKRFEIPLYSGTAAAPIRFDKPGVVVVGCNIHDWMVGHIVVLDTPWFAKTAADGVVRLDVPAGTYTLQVWHARGGGGNVVERSVTVPAGGLALALPIKLAPAQQEARGNDRLRALQDKFRRLKDGQ